MFQIFTLIKQKFTTPLVIQLVFAVLICSLFLEIKYPLITGFSYFLGEKKDFTIIFAYLSDIILLGWVAIVLYYLFGLNKRDNLSINHDVFFGASFLAILLITSYYVNFGKLIIPAISLYILLYLSKFIVLHGTIAAYKGDVYNVFKSSFLILIGFESLLAVYQFWNQASFGLNMVGESVLGPYVFGVAKVEALGQVFIRSYGTFAHPNIFGAFLVISIIISLGMYINASFRLRIALLFLLSFQIYALILSFSRSAWLVAFISSLVFVCLTWNINLHIVEKLYPVILTILLSLVVLGAVFLPFFASRGQVSGTKAYSERVGFNSAGLSMVQGSPVFGVGPGQSLLHMKQYLKGSVEAWDVQPIHNYYLIFAAELGLPALMVFSLYIFYVLRKSFRLYKAMTNLDVEFICLLSCFIAILILMMFDHYFYTLQSPAIMFWVVLGLLVNKLYRLEKIGEIAQYRIMNHEA